MSKQLSQTAVRLCYMPNSKTQAFGSKPRELSKFQIQTLLKISQHPNFDHFVLFSNNVYMSCNPSVIHAHVYDRLGYSVEFYISKTKILNTSKAVSPTQCYPEVYAVRCIQ